MGVPAPLPSELRGAPFLGSAAVAAGLVTRKRLLGPSFQRVLHGVYISRRVVIDHGVKCRAAALLLPESHAISGVSAAWCYGVRLAAGSHSVITATRGVVHVEGALGIRAHRTPLDPVDVVLRDGLRLTTPIRAAWDIAILEPLDDAIPIIDAMIHERLLTASELRTRVALSGGLWRVTRARQAFDLVDGRSESPPESRIRVAVIRAGLARPVASSTFASMDDSLLVLISPGRPPRSQWSTTEATTPMSCRCGGTAVGSTPWSTPDGPSFTPPPLTWPIRRQWSTRSARRCAVPRPDAALIA